MLADRLRTAYEEVRAVVDRCTPDQWQALTQDEGWTVAATARHIANSYRVQERALRASLTGVPIDATPPVDLNDRNAQAASDYAAVSQADVIALLDANIVPLLDLIASIDETALDIPRDTVRGAPPRTPRQIIEGLAFWHMTTHLASIRQAIGTP